MRYCYKFPSGRFSHLALYLGPILVILAIASLKKANVLDPRRMKGMSVSALD